MINLLRQYSPRLTALVPLECASAATMMALGADEIRMGPLAFLTAVDTSIRHELSPCDIDNELVSVSQDELARVIALWKEHGPTTEGNPVGSLMPFVHPLVVGAVDRASSLSIRLCREILSYHTRDSSTAERISNVLNATYPSHDYPITLREAERIGLNVAPLDIELNDMLLELNAVYSEMGQKAVTDFDEHNYHNNEIASIIERAGGHVLLPDGEGLALPQGRASLDGAERQQQLDESRSGGQQDPESPSSTFAERVRLAVVPSSSPPFGLLDPSGRCGPSHASARSGAVASSGAALGSVAVTTTGVVSGQTGRAQRSGRRTTPSRASTEITSQAGSSSKRRTAKFGLIAYLWWLF